MKSRIEGSGSFIVATWAEDFDGFIRFESREYAEGFCSGFRNGGGHYGAGFVQAVLCANPETGFEGDSDYQEMVAFDYYEPERTEELLRRLKDDVWPK